MKTEIKTLIYPYLIALLLIAGLKSFGQAPYSCTFTPCQTILNSDNKQIIGAILSATNTGGTLTIPGGSLNVQDNFRDTLNLRVGRVATASAIGNSITGALTGSGAVTYTNTYYNTLAFQILGTWSGVLVPQLSIDNTNWYTTTAAVFSSGVLNQGFSTNAAGQINISGASYFRFLGIGVTGTASVSLVGSSGTSNIMLDNPLPTGTNVIGSVSLVNTTLTSAPLTATASGTVSVGAKSILFQTSSDFSGTIDGLPFIANGFLSYPINSNSSYPAIPYTISAGTIYIRKMN